MRSRQQFNQQAAESMNDAAQISGLDILEKCADLHDKIQDLVDNSRLQPFMIFGILETIKMGVYQRVEKSIPPEKDGDEEG